MRPTPRLALLALLALAGCGEPAPSGPGALAPHAAASAEVGRLAQELGVPEAVENAAGMRFVLIPAGEFEMGAGTETSAKEAPAHEVRLPVPYYIQCAEVTNAQWRRVDPAWPRNDGEAARGVTFEQALDLARRLSAADPTWTYRLPTEAEWERAARHGAKGATPLAGLGTDPWEWCSDWFSAYPSWAVADPRGPAGGTERVLRGGPAVGPEAHTQRRHAAPDQPLPAAGVRLAISLGYGLGARGSCRVTFDLVHAEDGTPLQGAQPYALRFIRMQDRLAARTLGVDPYWVPVTGLSFPAELRMIPGKYYVYCETGEGEAYARGIEIKFHVHGDALRIDVPLPERDRARYGSSRPQ